MTMTARALIRWASYPVVFGVSAVLQVVLITRHLPFWPLSPLIAIAGMLCVALLERIQPYEPAWLVDHDDTGVDCLHAFTSLTLFFASAEIVVWLRQWLPLTRLWPEHLPIWLQVLLVGFLIDFGLWFMHWASHRVDALWRLHALHHSAERLYWLNGERRHPLSAIVLASPGIAVAVVLGAPALVIGCWLAIVTVHLAFQHANLDYRVGPLRMLLGVAENHRWHHKREYEDAQVNFGEFWMIWDLLFATYRYQANGVRAGEVGIRETMPKRYVRQILWPFDRSARG